MKKTKLIVPAALAVMLLSTAASVTGTVAWFTANRAVNTSVSSFTASSVGGNLSLTMGAGIGTTFANDVVSVASGVKLTDGSFDASSGILYRTPYLATEPAASTDNFVAISTANDTNYKRVVGTQTYYFAVTWTMQFDYKFAGDTTAVNLYFNLDETETVSATTKNKSRIDYTSAVAAETGHSEQTYKGFRIAFVGTTGSTVKTVWAPEQTSANVKRISATTDATDGVAQAGGVNVLANGDTAAVSYAATPTAAASGNNYLGQFTTSVTSIIFTCTAWFEGTDANVINEAEMDTVTAHMHFFVTPTSA